ncbi:MAG: hypothetical protein HY363_01335 [Candidatus Aenigmarchaeota archaeon]|nr:hypothetical protein [Candidatus Aenigmarchaeota archaeon]
MTDIIVYSDKKIGGIYSEGRKELELIATDKQAFQVTKKNGKNKEHEFDVKSAIETVSNFKWFKDKQGESILEKITISQVYTAQNIVSLDKTIGIEYVEPQDITELLQISKFQGFHLAYFWGKLVSDSEKIPVNSELLEKIAKQLETKNLCFEKINDDYYTLLNGCVRDIIEQKPPFGPCVSIDTQNHVVLPQDIAALNTMLQYFNQLSELNANNPILRFCAFLIRFRKYTTRA